MPARPAGRDVLRGKDGAAPAGHLPLLHGRTASPPGTPCCMRDAAAAPFRAPPPAVSHGGPGMAEAYQPIVPGPPLNGPSSSEVIQPP